MSKRKLKEHLINREWCKGCGIFEFCAKKFLELDSQDKAVPVRTYGLQHPATGKTMVCVPTEVSNLRSYFRRFSSFKS